MLRIFQLVKPKASEACHQPQTDGKFLHFNNEFTISRFTQKVPLIRESAIIKKSLLQRNETFIPSLEEAQADALEVAAQENEENKENAQENRCKVILYNCEVVKKKSFINGQLTLYSVAGRRRRAERRRGERLSKRPLKVPNWKVTAASAAVLALMAGGTVGVVTSGVFNSPYVCDASSAYEAPLPDYLMTFQNVLEGRISEAAYVCHLENAMPEVLAAKKRGEITGIFYNPSPGELEDIAASFVGHVNPDATPSELAEGKAAVLKAVYQVSEIHSMSTIYELATLGSGNPAFVIVRQRAFTGSVINDADFRESILHELEHAEINYSGYKGMSELYASGKLSAGFILNFIEFSIYGGQLRRMLANPEGGYSNEYLGGAINRIYQFRDSMCPSAPEETGMALQRISELPSVKRDGGFLVVKGENAAHLVRTPYNLTESPPCLIEVMQ